MPVNDTHLAISFILQDPLKQFETRVLIRLNKFVYSTIFVVNKPSLDLGEFGVLSNGDFDRNYTAIDL